MSGLVEEDDGLDIEVHGLHGEELWSGCQVAWNCRLLDQYIAPPNLGIYAIWKLSLFPGRKKHDSLLSGTTLRERDDVRSLGGEPMRLLPKGFLPSLLACPILS